MGKAVSALERTAKDRIDEATKWKIIDLKAEISTKQGLIQRFSSDSRNEKHLLSAFEPSKTSKNGLNFVSNKDIEAFKDKEKPEMLVNLLEIMHVFLKEPIPSPDSLIANLFDIIMPQNKVDTIKDLFLGVIIKNLDFNDEEFEQIIKFNAEKSKTLGPGLMKISRSLSYISFIMKEIIDYAVGSFQEFEGTRIQNIRLQAEELNKLQLQLYNLENSIAP